LRKTLSNPEKKRGETPTQTSAAASQTFGEQRLEEKEKEQEKEK